MKFGILSFGNTISNLGDWVQSMGVLKTYQRMGIPLSKVVKIDRHNLKYYHGEKIILPMSGYFNQIYSFDCFPLSKDIIPVFLGFHCTDEKIIQYLEDYKNSFFGCRDLATASIISKAFGNSDNVFMSGCFSLCLDKRNIFVEPTKIFMVDVIPEFIPYIPREIKEKAQSLTQITYSFLFMNNEDANQKSLEITEKWLDNFKTNAKLVITSRLHLALPCVAMGIPVIVARNYFDDTDRYSGYNGLFHVYMPYEFSDVNWDPPSPDIEWMKKEIMDNAAALIQNTAFKKSYSTDFVTQYKKQVKNVSTFLEKSSEGIIYYSGSHASYLSQCQKEYYYNNRKKYNNILEYIVNDSLSERILVIWGAGDKGNLMMRRYKHIVTEFKKCFYVDSNPQKQNQTLNGFPILSPDEIKNIDKEKIIIIIAIKNYDSEIGRKIASDLYHIYHFKEGKEFFFLDKIDSSARMALDEIVLNATLM